MIRKAAIISISGPILTKKEIIIIKKEKPWGIILFKRNILSENQLTNLIKTIKKIMKDKNYPILIDQEGGRVNRLNNIFNSLPLTGEFFGNLYLKDKKKFFEYYKIFINQTCLLLKSIGVNINTLPVLDLRSKGSSSIIGDRSFSKNPKIVSKIGDICINLFHSKKIGTVIKHIPGHGLAKVDSHKLTPSVKKKLKYLKINDFSTFKMKSSLFAMTAHIIYSDIDNQNTATHSKKVIQLIRKYIKFRNLIMTDDISMKSLKGSIKESTIKAFEGGCDIVLHCNANFKEMNEVAIHSPLINKFIIKKTSQFYKIIS